MNMVSMKNTKSDKKQHDGECAISSHEDYPYGLSLNLEDVSLKKLGITKLPDVGEEMKITAVGVVTNISEHSSKRRKSRSVSIQLQQLDVSPSRKKTAVDAVSDSLK